MPLTPEDVANKQFSSVRLREGYDMEEVDQFLDDVEQEIARLLRENDDLRGRLTAAERAGVARIVRPRELAARYRVDQALFDCCIDLGREAVDGNRYRPDGIELRWKQIGINGLIADPQVPYFIQWEDLSVHPANGSTSQVHIGDLQIAGDPARVREWLGVDQTFHKGDIHFTFVAPHGTPGLLSVTFQTPDGPVTI